MTRLGARLSDVWRLVAHRSLRLAPVETASAAGALLAHIVVRTSRRRVLAAARANLRLHRPGASDAEIARSVSAFLDNIGRVMAEFSVIDRIAADGRIALMAPEAARALVGRRPLVCLMLHTGNWEMFGPALRQAGMQASTFYEPPASAAERWIAERVRRRMGLDLLTPDRRGVRRALELLGKNATVAIFVDEARSGRTLAPLFGRPPHARGNLSIAARLARRANAQVVIGHCERLERCRFHLHVSEPFALPEPGHGVLSDVAFLNDRIEPVIIAHLDQWYFLDDSIAPIEDAREEARKSQPA